MKMPPSILHERKSFLIRVWKRKGASQDWIGEVQEVDTGVVEHAYGLEALFELIRTKIEQPAEKKQIPSGTTPADDQNNHH